MDDNSTIDKSGERIAKAIARAGMASRREAELWIAAGRVAVNGAVIQSPALNVGAGDRISIDGEPLPARERTRLFLYHKPRGRVTTHADPQERPTIFQGLPKELPRLISVGRLDFNTEGLLLLTNDGGLARVLELPATGWLRRYRVRAHGSVTQDKLDELRGGLTVDGIHYGEIEATLDRVQGSNIWLTFAIREGKNREVRNVLGHFGLTVTRLIRTSFGPFQLGEIAEGAVEEVPSRVLREQLGERLVAQSGADFAAPIMPITPPAEPPARDMRRRPPVPGKRPAKEERPKRGPKSPSPAHSWRAPAQDEPGKKLRREFRGSRREVEKPHEQSAQKSRTGLLTDRKGRRVLVERVAQPARERAENAPSKAAFKRTFKDRPKGPFKERPKGPFKERPKGAFKERHKGSQTDARRGRRGAPDRSSGARPHRPRER